MLCQACQQNPASVRVIDVTHPKAATPDGAGSSAQLGAAPLEADAAASAPPPTTHEQFLCEACAQAQHELFGQAKDLAEVWKLLKAQQPATRKQPAGVACPDCGMTLRDFRQRGRLGCPKDYEIFGAQLRDLLERLHGSARHVGRGPDQGEPALLRRKRLDELQQALASAIRDEAYEEAAKLRDEIKSLERS